MKTFRSAEELFWAKVNKEGPIPAHRPLLGKCWIWTASTRNGYGQFGIGNHKSTYAHRWAWERKNGTIPKGLLILHACDNRACVNDAHLFIGTHLDNCHDKIQKGRQNYGARIYQTQLLEADVRNIRLRAIAGESQTAIARDFAVQKSCISKIVNYQRRSNVR